MMKINSVNSDLRDSARVQDQAKSVLAALQMKEIDANQPVTFPQDFSASGTGKGGDGGDGNNGGR